MHLYEFILRMKTMIACDNIFCIYWKKNICILEEISLDIQGSCTDCNYVSLDPTYLAAQRAALLEKYEEQDV